MPVKELASAPPISARKRIESNSAPELMETPLPVMDMPTSTEESGKRRMPENLKKYLVRVQGGKYYLPAAYRIVWFRDENPEWCIATSLVEGGFEAGFATVKAEIFNPDARLIASNHKTESKKDFPAGWVEKASTGAIARALSLVGYGTQFSPELDDETFADSPQPARSGLRREYHQAGNGNGFKPREEALPKVGVTDVWEGPGQCTSCHAPEGKRHGKPCVNL